MMYKHYGCADADVNVLALCSSMSCAFTSGWASYLAQWAIIKRRLSNRSPRL